MKLAIALLTALLSTATFADADMYCPVEAVLPNGGCMDPDILATQLEYRASLDAACKSNNPGMERNAIILEVGILHNLSKFVPKVGFNGLTAEEVAAIQEETDRIVPQYMAMLAVLTSHTCK